jgi:hypothetical protein
MIFHLSDSYDRAYLPILHNTILAVYSRSTSTITQQSPPEMKINARKVRVGQECLNLLGEDVQSNASIATFNISQFVNEYL